MVDKKKVEFRPAVETSYLDKDNQYVLLDTMEYAMVNQKNIKNSHRKFVT